MQGFLLSRHPSGMRILASLLLLSACAPAQLKGQSKLSPQDENEIRAAIEEQAKRDNQRPRSDVWSERGPVVYRIRHLEAMAADVAIVDADGLNTGTLFDGPRRYTFVFTRTRGNWVIARKIPVCSPRPMLQPLSGSPRCAEPGFSDCPN
jgi:hypothetical protein